MNCPGAAEGHQEGQQGPAAVDQGAQYKSHGAGHSLSLHKCHQELFWLLPTDHLVVAESCTPARIPTPFAVQG